MLVIFGSNSERSLVFPDNFPYTFGYLFALGVYAHGETAGEGFHAQYVALLRDTGRMTAEELVQHHLSV